jgi:hypothetical protein
MVAALVSDKVPTRRPIQLSVLFNYSSNLGPAGSRFKQSKRPLINGLAGLGGWLEAEGEPTGALTVSQPLLLGVCCAGLSGNVLVSQRAGGVEIVIRQCAKQSRRLQNGE